MTRHHSLILSQPQMMMMMMVMMMMMMMMMIESHSSVAQSRSFVGEIHNNWLVVSNIFYLALGPSPCQLGERRRLKLG